MVPRCLRCGNTTSFYSSRVHRYLPATGPAAGGLAAAFDGQGQILNLENMGGGPEIVQHAWRRPEDLFDHCAYCGSDQLAW